VISAGIIGAAIARELSRYHCASLTRGGGRRHGTKATAILHTGFDAKPGAQAGLVRQGYHLLNAYASRWEFRWSTPVRAYRGTMPTRGAAGIAANAEQNGYLCAPDINRQLYRGAHLGRVRAAREITTASSSFSVPLALATQAVVTALC
jgi:hypothetical protein